MSNPVSLDLSSDTLHPTLSLMRGKEAVVRLQPPFHLAVLGYEPTAGGYTSAHEEAGTLTARGALTAQDGTTVEVEDTWRIIDAATVQVDRRVSVTTPGVSNGLRIDFRAETAVPGTAGLEDWQFFIPGALYNKNDTDHDGREDYLGTYVQDFRDDRLASLAVLAYAPALGYYIALTRADLPTFDTSIPGDDLLRRHFVQDTDIGSLGLTPTAGDTQISLRASYPFAEEYTWCLSTERDGWSGYLENTEGRQLSVSYQLRVHDAESLTDAIWDISRHQMAVLETAPTKTGFSLLEGLDYRMLLTQQFYRAWDARENAAEPAGYLVHFSPRTGETLGSLLEYGFSGAQTLLAYASMRYGYMKDVPLWVHRARTVAQFFVDHCQLPNGFSHGIYDPIAKDFVYWFTGILMPFQYASDEESLKRYLGSQITTALAPIAHELREVKGNYTRTMCESFYPLLLAYDVDRQHGIVHEDWLDAGRRFGTFLLETQAEDGSWYRAYSEDGVGLESPPQWFGATDTERKSGTIFPIEVLVELYRLTQDRKYLEAAERAADFIIKTYVDPVEYVGGLNDTTHIKSVKTDSVGVMFVMRSLITLHSVTKEPRVLAAAVKAAKILSSWVYLWNVPLPEQSLLSTSGFKSIGWAVCDVLPAGSYLDNEFLEFTGDLVKVAEQSGEEGLFDIAEIVQHGMQFALSTPHNMLGYVAPGIQCEGIMTGYWMSDPEVTEFSGAANKVKGQDNDTCNGLTNGQAGYALYDLLDTYGTVDCVQLRETLFAASRSEA